MGDGGCYENTSLSLLLNPARHLFKHVGNCKPVIFWSDDLFQLAAGNTVSLSPWLW